QPAARDSNEVFRVNCKDFEAVVNDLARASEIDAAARKAGLEHAESCELCAARLQDERTLTCGLRALGASFSEVGAPARCETTLLSAFHAGVAAQSGAPLTSNQLPASRWKRARWFVGAAAAAAAFALVM